MSYGYQPGGTRGYSAEERAVLGGYKNTGGLVGTTSGYGYGGGGALSQWETAKREADQMRLDRWAGGYKAVPRRRIRSKTRSQAAKKATKTRKTRSQAAKKATKTRKTRKTRSQAAKKAHKK